MKIIRKVFLFTLLLMPVCLQAMQDNKAVRALPVADEKCPICLGVIRADDSRVVCGPQIFDGCNDVHKFHGKCIAVLLRTPNARCPLCRAPLYTEMENSEEVLSVSSLYSTSGPIRGAGEPIPPHITDIGQILPRYGRISKILDLECCDIESIAPHVFGQISVQLPELQKLNLMGNHLAVIPAEIGLLRNLRNLNLCMNKLQEIPLRALAQLNVLVNICVCKNPLVTLPEWQTIRAQLQRQNSRLKICSSYR